MVARPTVPRSRYCFQTRWSVFVAAGFQCGVDHATHKVRLERTGFIEAVQVLEDAQEDLLYDIRRLRAAYARFLNLYP